MAKGSDPTDSPSSAADPLRQMAHCHEMIAGHLAELERIAEWSRERAAASPERMNAVKAGIEASLHWFQNAGPRHQADEDASLFPRLATHAARDPALEAALQELVVEHREEGALLEEFAAVARRIADEPTTLWSVGAEYRTALGRFAGHYRRHMDVEDRVVFPRAQACLNAETLAVIGAEMEGRRGRRKGR